MKLQDTAQPEHLGFYWRMFDNAVRFEMYRSAQRWAKLAYLASIN